MGPKEDLRLTTRCEAPSLQNTFRSSISSGSRLVLLKTCVSGSRGICLSLQIDRRALKKYRGVCVGCLPCCDRNHMRSTKRQRISRGKETLTRPGILRTVSQLSICFWHLCTRARNSRPRLLVRVSHIFGLPCCSKKMSAKEKSQGCNNVREAMKMQLGRLGAHLSKY